MIGGRREGGGEGGASGANVSNLLKRDGSSLKYGFSLTSVYVDLLGIYFLSKPKQYIKSVHEFDVRLTLVLKISAAKLAGNIYTFDGNGLTPRGSR